MSQAGIQCDLVKFEEDATEAELLAHIHILNSDSAVHGILVQLPLPKQIDEYTVTSAVADEKDVDGFGTTNIGELAKRGGRPAFIPCTPKGVMALLEDTGVDLKGRMPWLSAEATLSGARSAIF